MSTSYPSSTTEKGDIQGPIEIKELVDLFYAKVRKDELLGYIFDEVAKVDWSLHLPKLYAFWQTVLFGNGGFRGNLLGTHLGLVRETPMDWQRFERWVELFITTIDELYVGDYAEHIKRVAFDMANVMYSRINNVPDRRFATFSN